MSIDAGFFIDPTARVNIPFRLLQGCVRTKNSNLPQTLMPERLFIGAYAAVGENVSLGNGVVIDSHCIVESGTSIGDDTLLLYRAIVCSGAIIGTDCVIGGFVSEGCLIGDRCRFFGSMVHAHNDTTVSWDHSDVSEPSVILHDDSFVGFGATLIGGIQVGPKAYVCAGATITKAVPPYHIASDNNRIIHYSKWRGKLRENPIFKEGG